MNSEREERKKRRERERDRGAIRGRRVFHAAVGACARIHTHTSSKSVRYASVK